MTPDKNLLQLATLYGIQTSYLDMRKERKNADPEALLLVLRAMGAGVERFEDVRDALARRKEQLRKRTAEPVMVAWDGKLGTKRFEFGYHEVEVKGQRTFVISAPTQAFFPAGKRWGLFVPVYSLHSNRNRGAGDLTDFENVMDWMHGLGGTVAATLPLLGAFLNEPFEPSPYSPATRLFWNEFYIDVERTPESGKQRVDRGAKPSKYVDYRKVMRQKRGLLEQMARRFFSQAAPERRAQFTQFLRENKGVEDYARFRAVVDRRRTAWNVWPQRLRDGKIQKSDYDEATQNYHLYAQWIIQEQLQSLSQKAASRGQLLYLDLPLGLNGASYDIWRNRDLFVQGVAGGAPPDPVFTKGQNWGFPPMNPEAMRLNRYQYVIAYLRNHFRYAKLLRIDHVMGLHRLYWIPDELTGDKGVYVEYPAEELWAILCLESHRYKAGIVGENLGTVPPAVNAAMKRHAIREMYVTQYEIMGNPQNPVLRRPPAKSVASLNTHDMPPFRAFLDGTDIDDRLDLGFLNEKGARNERKERSVMRRKLGSFRKAIQFLSESMANIVLINAEDLWEETLPQNVPATNTERPNWRRRVRPRVEQIRKMAGIAEVLSHVLAQRSRSVSV
ncbi:MAG TPA: 4-alpha-glucanotransferase [Terriglobia bacterium]|nr:4-alpha-glucanotransferase [Terriglobia bacterium]